MNQQHSTGGASRPEGRTLHIVHRDLGDLRSRPSVQKAPAIWRILNALRHRRRDVLPRAALALSGLITTQISFTSELQGRKFTVDPRLRQDINKWAKLQELLLLGVDVRTLAAHFPGLFVMDYGVLGTRLVTTAGVNYLVDSLQGSTEPENLKFHGYGTGTTAEATGDTALVTEESTQYATDNVRPTGSQGEGASANVYRTTATYSPDSGGTRAITEHGIFSQAATGGGTLLDRTVFSAVNLVAGSDSLQTQYDLTINAGG